MGLECPQCAHAIQEVYYRRPLQTPQKVRLLWLVLAVAGAISLVNIGNLLGSTWQLLAYAAYFEGAIADPSTGSEPVVRDYFRILTNTAALYIFALVVAFALIGGRYFMLLLRGLRTAHPRALNRVRGIAWIQLLVEGFSLVSIAIVFSRLEVIQHKPGLGWGVVISPIILWLTSRREVRQYFSYHRIRRAPDEDPKWTPVAEPAS